MAQETMKTGKKEPRSIKDILLDIAEDPNDDYGKTLRKLPCIQTGLNERRSRRQDNKKLPSFQRPESPILKALILLYTILYRNFGQKTVNL